MDRFNQKEAEFYKNPDEAFKDMRNMLQMLKLQRKEGEVVSKISEEISYGNINGARKLKDLINFRPNSKEEEEYINAAITGIKKLLINGGSATQAITAAQDHGVPPEKFVLAAKEAIKTLIEKNTKESLESASRIAHAINLTKNEVRKLIYETITEMPVNPDKANKTLDTYLLHI
ncbi:MAG: hypothetical protein ACP5TL_02225 [Candidatus Micrarchaeia archaeon]